MAGSEWTDNSMDCQLGIGPAGEAEKKSGTLHIPEPLFSASFVLSCFIYWLIWLHGILVVACGIFVVPRGKFPCNTWTLVAVRASVVAAHWLSHSEACEILIPLHRDWTCMPCIARWILNPWTTREAPRCQVFYFHSPVDLRLFAVIPITYPNTVRLAQGPLGSHGAGLGLARQFCPPGTLFHWRLA